MKRTIISVSARTEHHVVSGSTYTIDQRLERRGSVIYVDRTYVDHPEIAAVRSVILPEQYLWLLLWKGRTGPHPCRCYMHMAQTHLAPDTITVEDLFLDVIVLEPGGWELLDVDEFRAAIQSGELNAQQVQAALIGLENACRIVRESGADLEGYLRRVMRLDLAQPTAYGPRPSGPAGARRA